MSHLLAPQEEKKATQSEPAINDTSFLVPPQEEKSSHQMKNPRGGAWMVPPQEEKVDTARLRGEQSKLDTAVDRFEERIKQHRIERDASKSIDEAAQDKQQRDSVLSGSAGITGEDLGYEEKSRVVDYEKIDKQRLV
ncbi:hypothetical protein PYCCODRAFT_1478299 [Trametes coccinea BRFM310]|uniref:Uncharacterized protein n=1 Tax=Trametes coccinea (strain BRFM310) TaxID=1353009 RepID=A0A1Y2IK86_TRAC3|nr:hypothetical protein PYCCODRAFT_1478299 [Trametes coccinea BRFM310]